MFKMSPKRNLFFSIFLLFLLISSINTNFDLMRLFNGSSNLFLFFEEITNPDLNLLRVAIYSMFETLQIAFLGTFIGILFSIPFGLVASRNLFTKRVSLPVRSFLSIIRTIPSLLWAVFFVIIVGLGPFAGVLDTAVYSLGFMSKLHYESIESIDPEPYESISAIGASKIQLMRFVVLPQAAPNLLSQILYMFEYNVRASTILGFAGAGGIGFYIMGYLQILAYSKVMTFLLVVLITVLLIDFISMKIRDHYIVPMLKSS